MLYPYVLDLFLRTLAGAMLYEFVRTINRSGSRKTGCPGIL